MWRTDSKALDKCGDSGSVGLPLILLLTVLEASGASLQKGNPAENSSQLFFKPVVPKLSP